MRAKKLADGSTRDTDWQRKEYERLMGQEAVARQELLAKQERGACTCRRRTIRAGKGRQGYRTIHERGCIKFKGWMSEYLNKENASAAAHAKAIHGTSS